MTRTRSSSNGSSFDANPNVPDQAGVITRAVRCVIRAMRRVTCAAMGHENILWFERDRLSLRCIDCGRQTTGWILSDPASNKVVARPASLVRVDRRAA